MLIYYILPGRCQPMSVYTIYHVEDLGAKVRIQTHNLNLDQFSSRIRTWRLWRYLGLWLNNKLDWTRPGTGLHVLFHMRIE